MARRKGERERESRPKYTSTAEILRLIKNGNKLVPVGSVVYAVPNGAIPYQLALEMLECVSSRARWYQTRCHPVPDRTLRALEFLTALLGGDALETMTATETPEVRP